MRIDDFLNSNFNHLSDYQKSLIKKLFGKEEMDGDLPNPSINNISGSFMQNLSDESDSDKFEELIKIFNMSVDVDIKIRDNSKIIEEVWTSHDNYLKIRRYYEFTYENISMLPDKTRSLLKHKLIDNAVETENYELASEIRDNIK